MEKYTPRRAGKRWLEGAPDYILDCFRHKKEDGPGFDVLFTGSLLGTIQEQPQDFSHVRIMGLDLDTDGGGLSFELDAFQAVCFRYTSKNRRVKWSDLPAEVQKSVQTWAEEE